MTVALVLFTKAAVFPVIGLGVVYYLGFLNYLIKDKIACFFLLTNFCTPTAVNMITIAIINKFQVTNLSKMLVYQYGMGIITVTIWTAVYLSLFV
jgi:hypothetical protein